MKFLNISQNQNGPDTLQFHRSIAIASGIGYLVWWGMVELLLPNSFNPFESRFAVVLFCWAIFIASFFSKWISGTIIIWSSCCLWLITLHYFYLFHYNETGIDWVVGSYITVIAACACLQTESTLIAYSAWVLLLSVVLSAHDQILLRSIFLPGMLTVLAFAYFGLRSRMGFLERNQESSIWFQNLFNAVFEGVVVHEGGLIIDSNEPFASLFGYHTEEIVGMNVVDFVAPEHRNLTLAKIESQSESSYEVTGLRKDGSRVAIEIHGKTHLTQRKGLRIAAVIDLTSRKKMEEDRVLFEATQSALQMRDEFLSIASHELKTPLTNIKLQTQMALRSLRKGDESALSPEKMRRFIELTDRQADRLTRLVEEMLDVSKIVAGKLRIHREEFDLTALVRDVTETFEMSFKQSGSIFLLEAPESYPVYGDKFRIEQVISNLLSNAIKYGEGKPIRIGIERDQKETRLFFEDQGMGIPIENHARIFERFERAISSKRFSGLGLGLYISKYIIDAHGGKIEVFSRPNRGSTFTVHLPLAAENPA